MPAQGTALGIGSRVENNNALKGQNRFVVKNLVSPYELSSMPMPPSLAACLASHIKPVMRLQVPRIHTKILLTTLPATSVRR